MNKLSIYIKKNVLLIVALVLIIVSILILLSTIFTGREIRKYNIIKTNQSMNSNNGISNNIVTDDFIDNSKFEILKIVEEAYNNSRWEEVVSNTTKYQDARNRKYGEYDFSMMLYSSYAYYKIWSDNNDFNSLSNAYSEINDYINLYNNNSFRANFIRGLVNLGFNSYYDDINDTNYLNKALNDFRIAYSIKPDASYIYHEALTYFRLSEKYTNYIDKKEMQFYKLYLSNTIKTLENVSNYAPSDKLRNIAKNKLRDGFN